MDLLTMKNLEICFVKAKELGANWVGMSIKMEGFHTDELIINHKTNFDKKLEYLKKAYNDDLTHKFSKGISISGFTYGDTLEEIEKDLV